MFPFARIPFGVPIFYPHPTTSAGCLLCRQKGFQRLLVSARCHALRSTLEMALPGRLLAARHAEGDWAKKDIRVIIVEAVSLPKWVADLSTNIVFLKSLKSRNSVSKLCQNNSFGLLLISLETNRKRIPPQNTHTPTIWAYSGQLAALQCGSTGRHMEARTRQKYVRWRACGPAIWKHAALSFVKIPERQQLELFREKAPPNLWGPRWF